jgi:hypothetical protein
MTQWEYAYIEYNSENENIETWFATPVGNNGYDTPVPRKAVRRFVLHQQIARLCGEGWEIFQITSAFGGAGRYTVTSFPTNGHVFHFKRQA